MESMDNLINEAIEEELGVSETVSKTTEKISAFVLENVKKQPKKKISDGIQTNTFRFKHDVFGETIHFDFVNTYFSDVNVYFAYRKKYPKKPNRYTPDTETIHIETDFINEWHNAETLEGALQHELEHLFQNFNAGYARPKTNQYRTSVANAENKDNVVALVSRAIYFSEEREIYAFANQSYQTLMNMDGDPLENVDKTNIYTAYNAVKDGKAFIEKYAEEPYLEKMLEVYDTTLARLMEHLEWAEKEYAKYIGRVVVKVRKDKPRKDIETDVDFF
jgi:hypothetical protein